MAENKIGKRYILGAYDDKKRRKKEAKSELRGVEHLINIYKDGKYEKAVALTQPTAAPQILSLEQNYAQTLDFLKLLNLNSRANYKNRNQIMKHLRGQWQRFQMPILGHYYDFATIEQVTASVALIMASDFDCFLSTGVYMPGAVNIEKWNADVRRLLDEIGFLNMSGVEKNPAPVTEGKDWRVVRFRSAENTDGRVVHQFISDLGLEKMDIKTELYDGIVEALINVRQHAYPSSVVFENPHKKSWWMTGAIDFYNKTVSITTLDRGATIPYTLGPAYFERFPINQMAVNTMGNLLQSMYPRDGIILRDGMKYGISSTGLKHRGKGLPHMQNIIEHCKGGTFRVYSRCGKYVKELGQEASVEVGPVPLDGTLINWSLKV